MTPDELFLHSMSDLDRKLASPLNEYDLLQAAAVLRKLVVDGDRLMDVVNRPRRLKIRFRIRHRALDRNPRLIFWATGVGFDPEDGPPDAEGEVTEVSAPKLMSEPIGFVQGQTITVRDLIVFMANVLGGVHIRKVHSPRERAVAVLHGTIRIGEPGTARASGAFQQIVPVGRVVVRGLASLRDAVR